MTEEFGLTQPSYDDTGKLMVDITPTYDELNRPIIRAESRDEHDSTYFTMIGDIWIPVVNEVVGTGTGNISAFYLDHKEVRNVTIALDSVPQPLSAFNVDYTEYDSGYNEMIHCCRGLVTFNEVPASGVNITASYIYAVIGGATETLVWDLTAGESSSTEVSFCDSVHIKDGYFYWEGGAKDSYVNVYAICPAGGYYSDNNKVLQYTATEQIISEYVMHNHLYGNCYVGSYYNVEARSRAIPPGYKIRITAHAGSANNFKGGMRIEINRQRTRIY